MYSKNIPEIMFVAGIFIALLITLNCACCPCNVELDSIRIAVFLQKRFLARQVWNLYCIPSNTVEN